MSLYNTDTHYNANLTIYAPLPISVATLAVSSLNVINITANSTFTKSLIAEFIKADNEYLTSSLTIGNQVLTASTNDLLLNGEPIATTSSINSAILSTVSNWALYPQVSTLQGNNQNIKGTNLLEAKFVNTSTLTGSNGTFINLFTQNLMAFNVVTFTSTFIDVYESTIQSDIKLANISTLNAREANVSSANISSLNAISASVTTLTGTSATFSNATINSNTNTGTLTVNGYATLSGGFQTGGANNFNNTNLDNVGRITANTVFIGSPNYINTQTSSFTAILNNRGADVGGNSVIDIKSQFGGATRVNITADASSALAPTPTQIVSITANGATSLTQNAVGGRVSIVANAGSGSGCNILGFGEIDLTAYSSVPFAGVIKESAGSILAYSGLTVPAVGILGNSFYSALICLSLTAGTSPATTSFPGVVYLRGDNGTKVVNGFFSDTITATGNSVLNTITTNGLTAFTGSSLSFFATSQNIQFNSATVGFNANIIGDFSVSTITNLSSINGSQYPPPSGAGVWASTATTALNMANFNINNVGGITMASAGNINLSGGNLSNVGNIFGSNLTISTGGNLTLASSTGGNVIVSNTLNLSNNIISNIYSLYLSNGANIDGAYPNQLNFNASNSYFLGNLRFYGSGRTLDIADNIVQNVTTLYGSSGGFLTLNAVNGMVIGTNQGPELRLNTNADIELRTLSTAQISINQTAGSDFTLFNNGDARMVAKRNASVVAGGNMDITTPSTSQLTIYQPGGSDFVLFNNGDTRMRAVRTAFVEAVGDAYLISGGGNVDIRALSTQNATLQLIGPGNQSYFQLRPDGSAIVNARNYVELIANAGAGGIYCSGAFTELRGYLTFNAVNNYINNLEAIYGDASAPGGGLAINSMYGLFFNSSGKNANLYIDSGNLNMINFNSGINIANYNAYGTGNVSLYSQNNDIFLGTGTGRDINLNGGRYVSINCAQPGGTASIYTSTLNTTSLLDTNITANQNITLRADQPGNSITSIASTISLLASNNINITATLDTNITATANILTSAVSTINTVQNTYFTGGVSKRLDGVGILQPIIQFGQVSSSGSSGSVVVTIPYQYTAVNTYLPFACMADAPAAELYVSTQTNNTFEIGWQNGGGGNQLFNWHTMGN